MSNRRGLGMIGIAVILGVIIAVATSAGVYLVFQDRGDVLTEERNVAPEIPLIPSPPLLQSRVPYYVTEEAAARSCAEPSCPIVARVPQYQELALPYSSTDAMPRFVEFTWEKSGGERQNVFIEKKFLSPVRPSSSSSQGILDPLDLLRGTISPQPSTTIPTAPKKDLPPLRDINLQTVTAIRCNFKDTSGNIIFIRGSGVIINGPKGYVLTNRHVIDAQWASQVSGSNDPQYLPQPEICYGSIIDSERALDPEPKSTSPFSPYPYFDIKFNSSAWDFVLEPHFVPRNTGGFSQAEAANLDFAVLRIASWNSEKYKGGFTPPKLPSAPILASMLIPRGDRVLVPGYAYQAIGENSFETFRLLTVASKITEELYGDDVLSDIPMVYSAVTESPDIAGGRSGSPVFWRGYVAGIHQSVYKDDRSKANVVATNLIFYFLEKERLIDILEILY